MRISEYFEGSQAPFEGDWKLMFRSLPAGAEVTRAVVILNPVSQPGGTLFEETISLPGEQGDWGARKREVSPFSEVDFHKRRTLLRVGGRNLVKDENGETGASLQVDIGGLFVQINELGAMSTPDDGVADFTLKNADGGELPALATQKFKLTLAGQTPIIDHVDIRTTPSNLALHLGSQPAFWARPGELAHSETVPDFSDILNAYLSESQVKDAYYEIPLTLHSDSLCRLDVEVEIEFIHKQSVLPGGISEAALAFDHSTLPQGESGVIVVQLPAGAQVLAGQTNGRVRGSFENNRIVYGPTGKLDPEEGVQIKTNRAQASPLIFSENLAFSSIDLLLTSTSRTAQLAVDLVEDLDGKPGPQSVLPAQVNLGIDSQIAGKPTWISAPLHVEVQVKTGTRLWLVVQSLSGEALWSVISQDKITTFTEQGGWTAGVAVGKDQANDAPLGMRYTDTGGLAWRVETAPQLQVPLVGVIHLRQPATSYQVPISLQIGDGDSAQRVSLDQFEALGRVDFNLDFAEFAEAINQVAAASVSASPPAGEHLLNNEFEIWQRIGDVPRNQVMPVPSGSFPAQKIAVSPDGKLLYVATSVWDSSARTFHSKISIVETGCHVFESEFEIDTLGEDAFSEVTLNGLAISPGGRRAAVTTRNRSIESEGQLDQGSLSWIDLDTRQQIGKPLLHRGWVGKPVFSPDGSLLYLLSFEFNNGSIIGFDVALLEEHLLAEEDLDNAIVFSAQIGYQREPLAQILSPDGKRLFLVVFYQDGSQSIELWTHDFGSASWMPPVNLGTWGEEQGNREYDLALNPDGTRIVVANGATQEVLVLETRQGQRIGSIFTADHGIPVAVEVDPRGRFAFVAFSRGGDQTASVAGFDIARISQGFRLEKISIGSSPSDLVILPSGERLYIANTFGRAKDGNTLASLALGAMTPEEWTITSGMIQPICVESPYHRAAVLGDFSCEQVEYEGYSRLRVHGDERQRTYSPSAISQVIPVTGGVAYELSFWGLATTSEAVAEVIWYGGDCGVQQTDRVPFTAYEEDPIGMKCGLEMIIASGQMIEQVNQIIPLHRLNMNAPKEAELAEVRFIAPANEAAILDRISLQATNNALSNGDLQHIDEGRLAGWDLAPEGATGITLIAEANGLRFRNSGTREAALEQILPFPAQTKYEMNFIGQAAPSEATPRIEVIWLDAENSPVGTKAITGIPSQGSNRIVKSGDSPERTVTALLRIVVPPETNLLLTNISVQEIHLTTVPVYVIAQAPGELNVSDLQIVFDISHPTPSRTLPPSGLCPATPPDGAPGQTRSGCCYCPNCGETDDLCNPAKSETTSGQPAIEGDCCHCGAHIQQISSTSSREIASVRRRSNPPMIINAPADGLTPTRMLTRSSIIRTRPPSIQLMEKEIAEVLPTTKIGWSRLSHDLAAKSVPITKINGIGEGRKILLSELNVDTIPLLAAAKPNVLEKINGVSSQMALRFIADASSIMANVDELPAPLISCVMPTINHPSFIPKAIEYFENQDYPNRELIIIDDGPEPMDQQLLESKQIHYIRLDSPMTLGEKQNLGCQKARGPIIAMWNDAMWVADWRLGYQAATLIQFDIDICGLDNLLHYEPLIRKAWHSVRPPGSQPWLFGTTLCFRKSFWQRNPFPEVQQDGDIMFLRQNPNAKIMPLQAIDWVVAIVPVHQPSPQTDTHLYKYPFPTEDIQSLLNEDWAYYTELERIS